MKNLRSIAFMLTMMTVLTTTAQEAEWRGCRRGTPRPLAMRHRAAQQKQIGGDFYKGERRQLVVLAAFSDKKFTGDKAATMEQWDRLFNSEGYSEGKFKGSVHDYFADQSSGQLNLVFDLHYVELQAPSSKYCSTSADDENSQYLVNDVISAMRNSTTDWGCYDWNNDGYVNQLIIIFPGKGMNDGGGTTSIWPHQWWMSEHLKDRTTGGYCEPLTVTDAKGTQYRVDCYCALQEIANGTPCGSFGTICHEYTHCFGFPDFYGSSGSPREWELMDHGNNNGGGFCPPNYSAHERWLMGWLTPTELTTGTVVEGMEALGDMQVAYLIRNDGHAEEYYIVENRQQKGWDECLPSSGLVVFHIDYDSDLWMSPNGIINTDWRSRYTICPANNQFTYNKDKGWAYPYEGNDSLTNTSAPAAQLNHANCDGSLLMNKALLDMRVESGQASFRFRVDKEIGTGMKPAPAMSGMSRMGSLTNVATLPGGSIVIVRKGDRYMK
ncbi:MAG: M6 family metalloprotease domain-containing protein, partial [Prevotella sp.]|nr:M6 family metalloprotease domain-containing protein [Prevotella sp.]